MPHLALKFYDARNMVCPSVKSHWADLGNCFMPINLLPPFSGKWSEIWFHSISHKYVSLESLLHCFTKTMWPKPICVWDKCWKTNTSTKLGWKGGSCMSNLFDNLLPRGRRAGRGGRLGTLFIFVMLFKAALQGNHFDQHKKGPIWAILYCETPSGIVASLRMRTASCIQPLSALFLTSLPFPPSPLPIFHFLSACGYFPFTEALDLILDVPWSILRQLKPL